MDSRIATIARYTLLEALRTRLPALVFLALLALFGASFFIESITVTEGGRADTRTVTEIHADCPDDDDEEGGDDIRAWQQGR